MASVTLKGGDRFESVVWAASAEHKMVVFRQSPPHTFMKGDYVAVNVAEIESFVDKGPANVPLPSIKELTLSDASRAVADAIAAVQQKQAARGRGVTAEAQAIFDGLSKTLRCTWNMDQIVVMGTIIVAPPYTEDKVGLLDTADKVKEADAFKRVKQMVSIHSLWRFD